MKKPKKVRIREGYIMILSKGDNLSFLRVKADIDVHIGQILKWDQDDKPRFLKVVDFTAFFLLTEDITNE